jgi:hypothetical protein
MILLVCSDKQRTRILLSPCQSTLAQDKEDASIVGSELISIAGKLFSLFRSSGNGYSREREEKSGIQSLLSEHDVHYADWLERACLLPAGMIGRKQRRIKYRKENDTPHITLTSIRRLHLI